MTTGTPTPTATEMLLTGEQFLALSDDGKRTELVNGKVIEMPPPGILHGYVAANIGGILREFVRAHGLGRVIGNDSGVITRRQPDNVRGPDVSYFSYARLPKGPIPEGYASVMPELVFEVKSPSDRWSAITTKAGEYLNAGVVCVCVVDPETESVAVYLENELPRRHTSEEELTLPEVLPGFAAVIRQFFE
jgi:Uma2 family endonuclease